MLKYPSSSILNKNKSLAPSILSNFLTPKLALSNVYSSSDFRPERKNILYQLCNVVFRICRNNVDVIFHCLPYFRGFVSDRLCRIPFPGLMVTLYVTAHVPMSACVTLGAPPPVRRPRRRRQVRPLLFPG